MDIALSTRPAPLGSGARRRHTAAIAVALALATPTIAAADVLTFDFNALANNANNATVQTHMQTLINAAVPGAGSITVTGAKATNSYAGDSHVTGPSDESREACTQKVQGNCVAWTTQTRAGYSETLGTSDGGAHHDGLDTFLINANSSDRITMLFPFPIYSAEFDLQIFPDATCGDGFRPNCNETTDANWPDFTLWADGVQYQRWVGANPADPANSVAFRQSPASGWGNLEPGPQFLGESGLFLFANGVTKLEFVDWPRTIGIDNLVVGRDLVVERDLRVPTQEVPEPSSLALLLASMAVGMGVAARARRRSTQK